jgi:hypothetical protein
MCKRFNTGGIIMAKGSDAKENIVKKLKEAFGNDWIGEYSKKYYVWTQENGERIQIALSLTCPKVPVAVTDAPATGDFNFEDDAPSTVVAAGAFQPADITPEERDRVNDLMKKLGL